MMTLEQAFASDPETGEPHPGYDALRAAKVREVAEAIADDLKPSFDPARIAEWLMTRAEEMGRIDGNVIQGEIPERYTRSGRPIPVLI